MNQSHYSKIAENIRKYRLLNNLTQEAMAEKLNIDYQYYAQLEQGRRNFTVERIIDSCSILHVNIEDIITTDITANKRSDKTEKASLIQTISKKLSDSSIKELLIIDKFIDTISSLL